MRLYKSSDYATIQEWAFIRDMNPPPKWSLPETGIISDDVAVGFLILTNNHCGILDFFISNPTSYKHVRSWALDQITSKLIQLAKEMKVKKLLCDTQHPAIKERAIKHGFNSLGLYECFEKGL